MHSSANIAIYGGAFDPPTLGHLRIINYLLQQDFDAIWVLPSGDSTFGKQLSPLAQRMQMAHLAFGKAVQVLDYDARFSPKGRTLDLATALQDQFPKHSFRYIIGADNANAIDRWFQGRLLISRFPFMVFGRPGQPVSESGTWCLKAPHQFVEFDTPESSTAVRNAISNQDWAQVQTLVPKPVLDYLLANPQLYLKHTAAN